MTQRFLLLLSLLFPALSALGQPATGADFMESIGKMYVVVAVILVIFIGLVIYLIRMDRRITELEHQINEHDNKE